MKSLGLLKESREPRVGEFLLQKGMSSSNSCSEVLEMNSGLFPVDSKGCEFPAIAGSGFQLSTEAYHLPVRPSFTSILTHSSDLLFNQLMSSSRLMLIFAFTKSGALGWGAFANNPSMNSI